MFSPLLGRSNLTSFSINAFKSPLFATICHIIFLGKFRLAPEISQPKNRWSRWKVSMTTTGVRLIHPWHVNHPWPGEKCPWDVKLGWCRLLGISEWCTLGGWRKQALFVFVNVNLHTWCVVCTIKPFSVIYQWYSSWQEILTDIDPTWASRQALTSSSTSLHELLNDVSHFGTFLYEG